MQSTICSVCLSPRNLSKLLAMLATTESFEIENLSAALSKRGRMQCDIYNKKIQNK